ncbi:MAG: outer membrane protein assembly factor BamA [Candidatus Latescibacterota bacterium]|nr:outer membrane protein assembly factor BamA [Candidatus Latescibacterota bacterium]
MAHAGEAQKVVEIEVQEDLRKVAKSLILTTVGLEPGVELSQENVQQAVRDLQGLNVFEDIQIWGDPGPEGIRLIIMVEEYPALEGLRFKGQKNLKEKDMKEALGLVTGQVIAPKDVVRGEQKILNLYREKGYLRAEVKGQTFAGEEQGKIFVQYDIAEGAKVQIKQIRLVQRRADGTVVDSRELSPRNPRRPQQWDGLGPEPRRLIGLMETKEKHWWRKGEFSGDAYDEDKQKMLAYYRSLGFQQAAISRDSVYYDSTRRHLFIEVEIDEGRQYRLGAVAWDGNAIFGSDELVDKLELKEGMIYGRSGLELADMARFTYYEKGYLDTRVVAQETIRGDSIDVSFQIFEGQSWTIRKVEIAGNTKTREKVIRREIELRPGDIYQQNLVQESQRRIFLLNFFKDVQIQPEYSPIEDERLVDLTFNVEERPTGQASMGAGYSDRDKLVGQIGLRIPNFRGMGQNLDFSWEFGTRREQFLVGFTEPWLFDTPTSLSVRVYTLNHQYFDFYDSKRNSISVRVGRRLKKPAYSSLSLGYRLESQSYSDFGDSFNNLQAADSIYGSRYEERLTSSFELIYSRDTRDQAQFPTKGTLFSYTPEIASSIVAGDVDFHKHQVNFNYYRPSWWKFVWSLETKVAVVDGFSDADDRNLSIWQRFSPGGVDYWDGQVRGYPDRSLGPRTSSGIPVGGRSMIVANFEYRFPIAEQQVYGILFADAGNAWETIPDLNPLKLRRSLGFGFRVQTPMLGMIGFDFGYGFDREKVDGIPASWNTHFQFGPQFF